MKTPETLKIEAVLHFGGCQCGRIRYKILAVLLTLYVYHCRECQRQSASTFGMSMLVPRDALVILQGKPKEWNWVSESECKVVCYFCGECGTRLFHNLDRIPKITNIKSGTLDDTSWLKPVGNLWTRSAQPWVLRLSHTAKLDIRSKLIHQKFLP